jgi:hypothetical protein
MEEAVEEGSLDENQATNESKASRTVSPQQVFLGIFYIHAAEDSYSLDGK